MAEAPAVGVNAVSAVRTRLNAIGEVIPIDQAILDKLLEGTAVALGEDFTTAIDEIIEQLRVKGEIADELVRRLKLANAVGAVSNNNVSLMKALDGDDRVNSIRDFALTLGAKKIERLLGDNNGGPVPDGGSPETDKKELADQISRSLFTTDPTAVVQRVVREDKTLVADPVIRGYVDTFLRNQPDFDIATTSILVAIEKPDAFKGIPEPYQARVVDELKKISRIQALAPVPEAISVLARANMTSAFAVGSVPLDTFVAATRDTMSPAVASEIHQTATNTNIRNEQALITILQAIKGTGLRVVDGKSPVADRTVRIEAAAKAQGVDLNLERLFGSMDACACDDCTTVYSAASYFVELLNFLRNNNLQEPSKLPKPAPPQGSIAGSTLEKLFRRRPDLGNLQLTCENTNTVLPYIDLANEVMESFILSLPTYANLPAPKQSTLQTFNVSAGTATPALLAQPQNTQYEAYRVLAEAVYPATTLPYHQPLDSMRTFLAYSGVTRHELLDAFRPAKDSVQTPDVQALQRNVLDRSVQAEFLGFSQQEYIILTKEAFWSQDYFKKLGTDGRSPSPALTVDEYRAKVGVKPVHAYYGYATEEAMMDPNDVNRTGLQWVKAQFLPRTQIPYTTLVELIQTKWMNPQWPPEGKSRRILESLRFGYRFLQTLVDPLLPGHPWRKGRFDKLIKFLVEADASGRLHMYTRGIREWAVENFESLGRLIVIDSGEGPRLGVQGEVFADAPPSPSKPLPQKLPSGAIATLHSDGRLTDYAGNLFGQVDIQSRVLVGSAANEQTIMDRYKDFSFRIQRSADPKSVVGQISAAGVLEEPVPASGTFATAQWILEPTNGGACSIVNSRLVHLNGDPLTLEEWDRTHRFLRLWRKMGWSVAQTDMALAAVAPKKGHVVAGNGKANGHAVNGQAVNGNGYLANGRHQITLDNFNTPGHRPEKNHASHATLTDIIPETLRQFVAIKKLLPLTDLPLEQLLTFWEPIPTTGPNPLYRQLFFNHNILPSEDEKCRATFGPDSAGNYFVDSVAKISDHLPVVMAGLGMKAEEITGPQFAALWDKLDIASLSTLYRTSLLARVLGVPVGDIPQVFTVFDCLGNPFQSADNALNLVQTWHDMSTSGFTFAQFKYVFAGADSLTSPLGPTQHSILGTTMTLYNGLKAIEDAQPDLDPDSKDSAAAVADSARLSAAAQLLYDQQTVTQIVQLIEGTTPYVTSAPPDLELNEFPPALAKRLKYNPEFPATVQVTGILTASEIAVAKAAVKVPKADKATKGEKVKKDWAAAIERLGKQTRNFFNAALAGVFSEEAKAVLLAGDVAADPAVEKKPNVVAVNGGVAGKPDGTVNGVADGDVLNGVTNRNVLNGVTKNADGSPEGKTPAQKRTSFLKEFIPFLRGHLERVFVLDTMTSVAGLADRALTEVLLGEVLLFSGEKGVTTSALSYLISIKGEVAASTTEWKGYLRPPTADSYTIFATSDHRPAAIFLDGIPHKFPNQQEDPPNVWFTEPIKLDAGGLYKLDLQGQDVNFIQWRTTRSPKTGIPASSLLPDYTEKQTGDVFQKLYKAAIIANGFKLSAREVQYLNRNMDDFGGDPAKFAVMKLEQWKRLFAYATLRNSLPPSASPLIGLFAWCDANPDDNKSLSAQIVAATGWDKTSIETALAGANFTNGVPKDFRNEIALVKLQKLLKVADKIRADIPRIFRWAAPLPISQTWDLLQSALDIQKSLRSRFDTASWEKVVQPLNDALRENQKNAMISYLLVQEQLISAGVKDADGLFEFFLIDVQMTPLMQTSRIKQAISTVQLYIQRCLLGQEERRGQVKASDIDQKRWQWMQKYRVWEANRKVFLYPENWIDPSLRDDKSDFFKQLESELLQKDINSDTARAALATYVCQLDEVANLQAIALYNDDVGQKIYVFSRTYTAPYVYYWRFYNVQSKNWKPWEKMLIDVPDYTAEGGAHPGENGSYIAPVVWDGRLLVFLPHFTKKTSASNAIADTANFEEFKRKSPTTIKAVDTWDIRIAWTEYRNGKWLPKQLSSESINDPVLLPLYCYAIVPTVVASTVPGGTAALSIRVCRTGDFIKEGGDVKVGFHFDCIGGFDFNGGALAKYTEAGSFIVSEQDGAQTDKIDFGAWIGSPTVAKRITSLQATADTTGSTTLSFYKASPDVQYPINAKHQANIRYRSETVEPFYHRFAPDILTQLIKTGDIQTVYTYLSDTKDEDLNEVFGGDGTAYHELNNPYSLYNWELGIHAPMLLVDRLLKSQKFDDALGVCHLMFNPLGKNVVTDPSSVWVFPPFRKQQNLTLEAMFMGFSPDKVNPQVTEWRDNPFQPHVIARSRPVAYMKWIAMKYIEILIAYGDYYFMQNTLETVPLAIQMYVMASHLYGPRGQVIPRRNPKRPQTYNSLLGKWDAFGNAMVDLELAFPFSNQTVLPMGLTPQGEVEVANIFGFATSLYFAIPDNPNLRALGLKIDDRLFKLRHSQDISGVFRQLPLFEPPIDPKLLVEASAKGLQLSTVLADLNGPMPNYRFVYLLQKALEVCSELKSLGSAFLVAKEKGDNEAYTVLRQRHDGVIQNAFMELRKLQLDEATKSLEALAYSRKGPVYRLQHYLKLIGGDPAAVPQADAEFQELTDRIETPVDDSSLKLSAFEKEEMDKSETAQALHYAVGAVETYAGIWLALPSVDAAGMPLGVGVNVKWGPPQIGQALQAVAAGLRIGADSLNYQSSRAGRKAGNQRQLEDRVLQANSAGYEIKNIDKQMLSARIRIDMATREIANHQTAIDQSREVLTFLTTKYTSAELYSWMESTTRSLYYEAYTAAYDLAKKAEKAYQFERPLDVGKSFIQPGYWDATRDGLLAGERLYTGLKQLEAAYIEKRGHDYEITKHISLRQLNPLELMRLRETGSCSFNIPEVLFDMDFPGHYMRRIRTVAVTMPAIVGPYTSVNATLRLTSHTYRTSPAATTAAAYPQVTDGKDDPRFSTTVVPITAVAFSGAQGDSGTFELNFKDERFVPFEGAGAISSWTLNLAPIEFRQFDYETLSDVVLHLRYTAVDGGDNLRSLAAATVEAWIKKVTNVSQEQGLWTIYDVRNEFATEWARTRAGTADTRTLPLAGMDRRLPIFTVRRRPQAREIHVLTDRPLNVGALKIKDVGGSGNEVPFSDGEKIGEFSGCSAKELSGVGLQNWDLSIAGNDVKAIGRLWMLVRYSL